MKTGSYRVNRFVLMAGCTLALGGVRIAAAAPGPKVTICHFPPGNPANVQVITVGAPAVPAHIANHDDAVCPAGDSDCCFGGSHPSVCTNFATDVNNCGACGNVCSTGATCTGGLCVAPTPTNTSAPAETPTNTSAPIETPTDTPVPRETPTDTPVPRETPTDTPVPAETATDTPTPTDTPAPAETPTDTPVPAETPTDTPAATETPLP